jgi:mannose-6-phosphate isomerase-like protein (cupin superfamily)
MFCGQITKEGCTLKYIAVLALAGGLMAAGSGGVDFYTPQELQGMTQKLAQKGTQFASENLVKHSNHYTMLAYREATGSAEVHEHEADFFVIESGEGTLMTGGKLVNPKTEKPGEIRGSSISGGQKRPVAPGDIVHIPAGTPHQLLVAKPISYFVIKVTGQ